MHWLELYRPARVETVADKKDSKTEGVMPLHKAMAEGKDPIAAQEKVAGGKK